MARSLDIRKLRNNKYIFWGLSVLLLLYIISEASREGDFKVFLEAAKTLKAHKVMYDVWLNHNCCKYFYSPLFALALIPFTYFPYYVANFIWLCADVYFLARIWKFILSKLTISFFSPREYNLFLFLTLLFSFRFILFNFDMVQMTIFLLWAMLECLQLFDRNKNVKGALLLALAINIKVMPVAMIPYLVLRKKFIPLLWVIALSVLFLYLPALFIGIKFNDLLLSQWFGSINPFNTEHNVDTSLGAQGITTWLATLLMNTGGELPLKRNIADLSLSTVNWIINLTRAFFILFTFYFTGFTFFKEAKSKLSSLWELSYLSLIIPLIFPHQEKYAWFLLFPAYTYLSYFMVCRYHFKAENMSNIKWYGILLLLVVSFVFNTLTSNLFIGWDYSKIAEHYKLITYGTLLVIFALAMCKPRYIEQNEL